jgi:hypothetical protein
MGNMRPIETDLTACLPPACHVRKTKLLPRESASCPLQQASFAPLTFFPITPSPFSHPSISVPFPFQWLLHLVPSPQDILLPSARPRKFPGHPPPLQATALHRVQVGATRIMDTRSQPSCVLVLSRTFLPAPMCPLPLRRLRPRRRRGWTTLSHMPFTGRDSTPP